MQRSRRVRKHSDVKEVRALDADLYKRLVEGLGYKVVLIFGFVAIDGILGYVVGDAVPS